MLSRAAYLHRRAIASSRGALRAQSALCAGTGRVQLLSMALPSTSGAAGPLSGRMATRRNVMNAGRSAFALGGSSTRGYGGSMYHFSAAEKEESAIVSEQEDVDEVAASGAGGDAGDSNAPGASKEEASESVKELCEQILNLDVVEMNQLLFRLQSRLGISDQMLAGVGSGGGGGGGGAAAGEDDAPAEAAKEKDAFDVKLTAFDAKAKIKIIKEVRAASGLGLKEAKELVEKAPAVIKEGLTKDEAEALAKTITDLGGTIELV